MPIKRHNEPGCWYHVLNRGQNKNDIFLNDKDKQVFLNHIGEATEQFEFEVHAFCLMDNHFHLLIYNPATDLSKAMRNVAGMYSTYFNKTYGRDGRVCTDRFKNPQIESQTHFDNCFHYIHNNAKDLAYVPDIATYQFSSLKNYIHSSPDPDWLITDSCRELIKGDLHPDNNTIMSLELSTHFDSIAEIERNVRISGDFYGLKPINTSSEKLRAKPSEISVRDATIFLAKQESNLDYPVLAEYFNLASGRSILGIQRRTREKLRAVSQD